GCGKGCPPLANAMSGCAGGACVIATCMKPFSDCDNQPGNGCETDTSTDLRHCGGCGKPCVGVANANTACQAGACAISSCTPGFDDCDRDYGSGCEAELGADLVNCGA